MNIINQLLEGGFQALVPVQVEIRLQHQPDSVVEFRPRLFGVSRMVVLEAGSVFRLRLGDQDVDRVGRRRLGGSCNLFSRVSRFTGGGRWRWHVGGSPWVPPSGAGRQRQRQKDYTNESLTPRQVTPNT